MSTPRIHSLLQRRRRRGAVVFVVAMTLALLALMGVYAVSSSVAEVRSSGYVRQATQAHYLSEYAMTATANYLNPSTSDLIVSTLMAGGGNPAAQSNCVVNPQMTAASSLARACWRIGLAEFQQRMGASTLPLRTDSLGQVQGSLFAEISSPVLVAPPPGFDTSGTGLTFVRLTVTTGGSVLGANNAFDALETGRARMTVGPIRRN